ncbi:LytTR family DNA-binding domain-containing protein [Clostridium faecium]|uniref:Stage 0 sporulation protein A homolog n=1 Tax=Clostridium faecium TaxID=2762223 RepID=A0ABR8YPA3_9CLOT|nr:LytTR family DNA-binding domain-containing protein [Clostridium faecium]MBD8046054.1 response regulator transcription factor [Clostridium faecium]
MKNIDYIIVEDEAPVRDELSFILKKFDKLNLVGSYSNGTEALNFIKKNNIQLIFLDINIPSINGIALAQKLKELKYNDIKIVFVTSYDDYAIKAFELEAVDYILKPFDEKRITNSINRIYKYFENNTFDSKNIDLKIEEILKHIHQEDNKLKKFPCELHGRTIFLDIDEIYFCFTFNNATYVKTKDKEYPTMFTLWEIEDKTNFFRIHRSYIINLKYVRELFPLFNYNLKVVMDDNEKTEISVSRNKVKELKRLLGL